MVSSQLTGIVFQSGRAKCQKYGMSNKEANQVLPPKYLKSSLVLCFIHRNVNNAQMSMAKKGSSELFLGAGKCTLAVWEGSPD
jgi:hypothetical protein